MRVSGRGVSGRTTASAGSCFALNCKISGRSLFKPDRVPRAFEGAQSSWRRRRHPEIQKRCGSNEICKSLTGSQEVHYFGYDPDDHSEEQHDTDDYEDEDVTYLGEDPEQTRVKGPLSSVARASSSAVQALGNVFKGVPRETVEAVRASTEGTAAVFSSTARSGLHQVREVAREVAEAARESPAVEKLRGVRDRLGQATAELPEGVWGKIAWLWDLPPVKSVRITITAAQWGMHIPTLLALAATQWSVVFAHVSPTMLAPLLFGAPMLLRSITTNASIIFPRIGVTAMVLWVLWSANGILQSAVYNLRKQDRIDYRLSSTIITCTEILSMITALVIILSMFGINVSALFFPAGVAIAFASKDLVHNFLAGFFLLAVQPFKVGDNIGVNVPVGSAGPAYGSSYFEGNCFKVDLRFTHIRRGRQKLVVPNANFLTNAFIVIEEPGSPGGSERSSPLPNEAPANHYGGMNNGASPSFGGTANHYGGMNNGASPSFGGHAPLAYPPGSGNHVMWPNVQMPPGFYPPPQHLAGSMDNEQHFMEGRPWSYASSDEEDVGSIPTPGTNGIPINADPRPRARSSGTPRRAPPVPPGSSGGTPRAKTPDSRGQSPGSAAPSPSSPSHAGPAEPAGPSHAGPALQDNGARPAGAGRGVVLQQYGPYGYQSAVQYGPFGQYSHGAVGWGPPSGYPPWDPSGGQPR